LIARVSQSWNFRKDFPCPETGCGEPALIESLAAEEFMVRRGEELTRKPPALQRI
jgi:hypothetical protein